MTCALIRKIDKTDLIVCSSSWSDLTMISLIVLFVHNRLLLMIINAS